MTRFTFDPGLSREFVSCGVARAASDPYRVLPPRRQIEAQMAPTFAFYRQEGNQHRHFLARSGRRVVGRISAFVNRDLQRAVGSRVGTVGFYESPPDFHVATELLDASLRWLLEQGVDRVWGPLNFDVWHGYRFMTRGFERDRFLGEPCNPTYYPEQFRRYGFREIRSWSSAEFEGREAFDRLTTGQESIHRAFRDRGYRFEAADLGHLEATLRRLHALTVDGFAHLPGFTPIDPLDFAELLGPARPALRSELLTFVHDDEDRPVAFTLTFVDIADAVRALSGRNPVLNRLRFLSRCRHADRAVLFMGAKVPAAAARLGLATFYNAVREIERQGFRRMVIALMEEGSLFDRLSAAARPAGTRRYGLFEWSP